MEGTEDIRIDDDEEIRIREDVSTRSGYGGSGLPNGRVRKIRRATV